jgi:hypothetical protein
MLKRAVGIFCSCVAFALCAEETAPVESSTKKNDGDVLEKYYPYEQRIAGWVDNTARGIDSFFGTDAAWSTENESWLRITNDFSWDQTQQGSAELRPRLKIDLPTASKRLRLLIENDSPEQRTAVQEAVPNLRSTDNERTTVVGLGTSLDRWAPAWRKSLQAGVRVAWPPEPYVRFKARRMWQLGGAWELNAYNRLSWFEQDGYSAKSEIKIGQALAPRWRIDFPTDLAWREDRDYLEFAESVNLTHIVNERSAISYAAGVAGTGLQGPQITGYFLSADYRRNISRRIIFVNLIPVVGFPRDEGFNPRVGFTFRLELYFQKNIED